MTIGTRLREVRQALNMSQTEFGAAGGVLKNAQSAYETDKRSPDANYLAKIAELGVDVNYVVTGHKVGIQVLRVVELVSKLSDKRLEALEQLLRSFIFDSGN